MATLIKRAERYYLQFYSKDCIPHLKKVPLGAISYKAAHRLKARLEDEYALGEYDPWQETPDIKLSDAVNRFLGMKARQGKSRKTLSIYIHILTQLCHHAGDIMVSQLRTSDIRRYLVATNTGNESKLNYVRHISVMLNWSMRQGWVQENVAKRMDLPSSEKTFPQRFSDQELKKLYGVIRLRAERYSHIPGDVTWLIPVIKFLAETGLDRSELCTLTWNRIFVDTERPHMLVFRKKSKKERVVPLTTAAIAILAGIVKIEGHVFRTSTGSSIYPPYLTRKFRQMCLLANLPYTKIHTLRHTAFSRMAEQGIPIKVIQRFAGHSSPSVTDKYMHISDDGYFSWFSNTSRN